jgi:hypothetical protein
MKKAPEKPRARKKGEVILCVPEGLIKNFLMHRVVEKLLVTAEKLVDKLL